MAVTENVFLPIGDPGGPTSGQTDFTFTFEYLNKDTDIKVSLDGVDTIAYTFPTDSVVRFNTAPADGVVVRIYRDTDIDTARAIFAPGSAIRAQDLNNNFDQSLYVTQEIQQRSLQADGSYSIYGNWNFLAAPTSVFPTTSNQLATKSYVDSVSISGVPDGNKGDITVSGGGTTWTLNTAYLTSADIGVSIQAYDADTVKTDVLPTFTVATRTTERTITAGDFDLATGNLWTVGAITVPNPTNAVAGQTGAIRITAGPVVWSSNFKFPGGGGSPTITAFPAIIPYYVQDSSTILMGNVVEGIA